MLLLATEQDQALSYDAMHGLLFGVAMTPDMVMPSEWLPLVFGEEMITIDSEEEGQTLLGTLMQVVNTLTDSFQDGALHFPFHKEYLTNAGDLEVIREWVYGLQEALSLRPECWFEEGLLTDSLTEEQEELMTGLSVINGIAEPDEVPNLFDMKFEEKEENPELRLLASLFAMLPTAVESLLDHAQILEKERREGFKQRLGHSQFRRKAPKVGRNAPCPCGSGKKHKKCCLQHEKIVPVH